MLFIQKQIPVARKITQSPLILLVGLTLLRGLIYLSIFPPFLAPDETAHFEAIRLIGQEKKWPTHQVYLTTPMHPEMDSTFEQFRLWTLLGLYSPVKNLGLSDNLFIHYYPTQIGGGEVVADSYLMLYHIALAPLSAAIASLDLAAQVYILRFVSVLGAALSVMAAWLTLRSVFPREKTMALAACSFMVFWPMHSHVTASINSDALAELIATLFFLILVQTYAKGLSIFRGIMLPGLLGLALFTKPTLFFLFPTLLAAFILYAGRKLKWPTPVTGISVGGLIVLTWAGSLFLYENAGGGRQLLSLLATSWRWPRWSDYITPAALRLYLQSLNFAIISFGGLFGWSNIHIPWSWVRLLAVFWLLVVVGVLVFIYQNWWGSGRKAGRFSGLQKEIMLIFLLAIVFSFIGIVAPIVATQSPTWSIHSRYYFPVIVPLGFYFFMGLRQLTPAGLKKWLWPGWLAGWILYDTAIFLVILLPFLYS